MATTPAMHSPQIEAVQEIRFAVVMYGGVSLAIYINGVAQELRRLVRATAATGDGAHALPLEELGSTEVVYRKLAQQLPSDEAVPLADVPADAPIRTRFVVDILSGTSAGGINALFLAKGLVNDRSIASLKELWVQEGDFGRLLHDAEGAGKAPGPPASLLDGAHMYRKLLEALDAMDEPATGADAGPSPNVRELDLYITATDLHGLPVPLRLADRIVYERRHRHAFHFGYASEGQPRNDFGREYNPFLAFAARCTSAFPFAFEPMRLCDIDALIARTPLPHGAPTREPAAAPRWRPFFADYLRPEETTPDAYVRRPFADGGFLDNKPFGYATDTLARRRGDVPVRRKLVYVEPAPEQLGPEDRADGDAPVDALQNVQAAVLSLPQYETIREDLQRVLARNRLVGRLAHFTTGVEEDLYTRYRDADDEPPERADWRELDLSDRIARKGVSYGGYHRLKVSALTDEVAAALMKAAGFHSGTDYLLAFRLLARAWREAEYVCYRRAGCGSAVKTENRFLVDFDVHYRLRRLTFVRDKLDRLWPLDPEVIATLRNLMPVYRGWWNAAAATDDERAEWGRVCEELASGRWQWPDAAAREEFRQELGALRTQLGSSLDSLYQLDRLLLGGARSAGDMQDSYSELVSLVQATHLTPVDLEHLLATGAEEACLRRASDLVNRQRDAFRAIADRLHKLVSDVTIAASDACRGALRAPAAHLPARLARLCVRAYYDYYEDFDLVLFPLLYPDQVGETAAVDVIRVSPLDAERPATAPKLAGTKLMNFGAFLRRDWRVNDLLWGRLDGAQRLITALLPNAADNERRQVLIDEAHRIILAEDLRPEDRHHFYQLFAGALVQADPGAQTEVDRAAAIRALRAKLPDDVSSSVLRLLLDDDGLLDYMRGAYEVDRQHDAVTELRLLARAMRVTGQVAEGIARKHLPANPRVAWLARTGLILWGVVEILIPDSFARLVTTHFFKLVYLFALLLLVGGLLIGATSVWRLGLSVLLVTAVVHGGMVWFGDAVAGRRSLAGAVRDLAVCTGAAFAVYGIFHLLEPFFGDPPLGWLGAVSIRDIKLVIGGVAGAGLVLLAAAGWRKLFGRRA